MCERCGSGRGTGSPFVREQGACPRIHRMGRRAFLATLAAVPGCARALFDRIAKPETAGPRADWPMPGHAAVPTVEAAFVHRKRADLKFAWPGGAYDVDAEQARFTALLAHAAKQVGVKLNLRDGFITDAAGSAAFVQQVAEAKPDAALVLLLDRHGVAWSTATRAAETGVPTVVFAPVGAAFTSNVLPLAHRPGVCVVSSLDFQGVRDGLKMVKARRQMADSRALVFRGAKEEDERQLPELGTTLRILPTAAFVEEFRRTPADDAVRAVARQFVRRAARVVEPTEADLVASCRTYFAALRLMARERADAITMDCLGPASQRLIPVPCFAWAMLNDAGIPAACEADLNALATLMLLRYLRDRPGFQQDPVPDTALNALIGSHCVCPTRLRGFAQPPHPFEIRSHHSGTGVAIRTLWRVGEPVTIVQFVGTKKLLLGTGRVLNNVPIPPAGGCRTAVTVTVEGLRDAADAKGFHQVFFAGDHARLLRAYAQMYGIQIEAV